MVREAFLKCADQITTVGAQARRNRFIPLFEWSDPVLAILRVDPRAHEKLTGSRGANQTTGLHGGAAPKLGIPYGREPRLDDQVRLREIREGLVPQFQRRAAHRCRLTQEFQACLPEPDL